MTETQLLAQDTSLALARVNDSDFISLADIDRVKNPEEPKDVVKNWLRSRNTIEYINSPNFKGVEFDALRQDWLDTLNKTAIAQMRSLLANPVVKKLT